MVAAMVTRMPTPATSCESQQPPPANGNRDRPLHASGRPGANANRPLPQTLAETATRPPLTTAADRQQRRHAPLSIKHKQAPAPNAGGEHHPNTEKRLPRQTFVCVQRQRRAPPPSQRQQPPATNAGGERHAHATRQKSAFPSPSSGRPPPTLIPNASTMATPAAARSQNRRQSPPPSQRQRTHVVNMDAMRDIQDIARGRLPPTATPTASAQTTPPPVRLERRQRASLRRQPAATRSHHREPSNAISRDERLPAKKDSRPPTRLAPSATYTATPAAAPC